MLREEYRQWRDWVYEHYPWAYALGTGVLALAAWGLCRPLRRRPAWVWGGYMATLGIGALLEPCVDPASSLYGSVLAHGRRDKPLVALTFDDGPHPHNTPLILEALAKAQAPATFFCLGSEALSYPHLVRAMVAEGHLVGSHTFSHRNLLGCTPHTTRQEIEKGLLALETILSRPPQYFRPPYGMRYPWTLEISRNLAQEAVLWSNCPRDWQEPGVETIKARVLAALQPGDIILLHDGGGDRTQTAQALPGLIAAIRERGYQLARVDQLERA